MTHDAPATERAGIGAHRAWEEFAGSRKAATVAVGWGFAEATLFFVVPDVWIGLLALFSRRAGLRAVAWAVVGAMIGGTIMFGVGARLESERSARLLDAVPAISPAMIERVEGETRQHGPASMMWGPLRGTPYKIYARTAGLQDRSLAAVLLWTVPARGVRFVSIALLAAGCGWMARRLIGRKPGWLLGLYVVAWTAFYAGYFWTYGF